MEICPPLASSSNPIKSKRSACLVLQSPGAEALFHLVIAKLVTPGRSRLRRAFAEDVFLHRGNGIAIRRCHWLRGSLLDFGAPAFGIKRVLDCWDHARAEEDILVPSSSLIFCALRIVERGFSVSEKSHGISGVAERRRSFR